MFRLLLQFCVLELHGWMTNAAKIGDARFQSNLRWSMDILPAGSGVKENEQQTRNFGLTRKLNNSDVDTLVISLLLPPVFIINQKVVMQTGSEAWQVI